MPTQDVQGRWISDDGLQYWDGTTWRPIGIQAPARRRNIALPAVLIGCGFGLISAVPSILIGCGFALVIVLVLGIGLTVLVFNNSDVQRSFCNGWESGNNSENLSCPFHPSPP